MFILRLFVDSRSGTLSFLSFIVKLTDPCYWLWALGLLHPALFTPLLRCALGDLSEKQEVLVLLFSQVCCLLPVEVETAPSTLSLLGVRLATELTAPSEAEFECVGGVVPESMACLTRCSLLLIRHMEPIR